MQRLNGISGVALLLFLILYMNNLQDFYGGHDLIPPWKMLGLSLGTLVVGIGIATSQIKPIKKRRGYLKG